ncbi:MULTISPECIES: PadR family transcriptional regulator [Mycolicibacterium]|uniref:Transcriptional regulator, PadR family n=2 Tax=Mycolicibacterium gilvum TaxID=1804 RepID=E6TJJ0_MYCSR|nr:MULTISPECIES: PadR family transcriptional regulator [Mycolicibacterium]ABP43812.1 transcriptional regulator, PadR family [Mycolicibacterium gilvum PYR-GCK]ADU01386.1 transcriptional regulator, PadR family [Mycolicibacterium gilvum Spyr1]MBV5241928.1 PadR family transcriptional regulator [Mycolicibacterium sp. PAM1]
MTSPFTPPDNPFERRGFGFGFGPVDRRALHERRRHARREFRDHVREHRGDAAFGPGFGGFGPGGFGPGGGGFGPGSFGPGFGFGPGSRRGGGPRGRSRRGDVRAAILTLLTDRPMHGYEMIQEINERSRQMWKPSPGSVYPTLQLLVDEGLIVSTEAEGSKKLFELTDDGRAAAEKIDTAPWDAMAEQADPGAVNLRNAAGQLMGAVAQSAHAATPEQQQRILDIVNNARREIYSVLGED